MVSWQARVAMRRDGVELPADATAAEGQLTATIEAALPGWEVRQVQLVATPVVGEWVRARKAPGDPEYARIVQGATDLQVEFADGTRRGLNAVQERV
ncbi:MAG: hypothetical protein ACRDJN_05725 [Chloroflexota bacterium]